MEMKVMMTTRMIVVVMGSDEDGRMRVRER
jgi:hypothetical protein